MTRSTRAAAIASALAFLAISLPPSFAQNTQDQSQAQEHHPASPQAAPDANPGDAGGMNMGMMSPGHMQRMTKMMREMHDKVMHGGMVMQPEGDQGPASLAFNGIAARMHKDMDLTYTGRTDVDFVKNMIPHQQAAIDMAKVEVAFGKDPEIRKMAEDLIKTRQAEVASLQQWLKQQGSQ